ncbi:MAG: hypothetical protein Q7O66_20085 [Dehalococcoidia bacterium]|nr:hypothetical protein [Dehalococcoidia bacterium]
MVRASVVAERAGVRSVSVVSSSFLAQGRLVAKALGYSSLPLAEYPGVIMLDDEADFRKKVDEGLVDRIIEGFASTVEVAGKVSEPAPRDIVFEGDLAAVQEHFYRRMWSDGLPIIPPTIEKVGAFLRFTDRLPDEVIGALLPEKREATVWNVAINGVMAGCRPEYMPVLLAIVEVIADPEFRIEDGGSTPGWEPLVIVNGPIVKDLDFNYEAGAMRVGRQANTSIGRFLRLYMRNIAGLRIPPGGTDKGTIAFTFNVAMAENEDVVAELGWKPFSVERGFARGENVVTVQSVVAISLPIYVAGEKAADLAQTIVDIWAKGDVAAWAHTGMAFGKWNPLLVLSPSIASAMARQGWTKEDLRNYLYEHAKMPAGTVESYGWQVGGTSFSLERLVRKGKLPPEYAVSADPERLVPIFLRRESIGIVVAGDAGRNQARGYTSNHEQGPPISKKVRLPENWQELIKG